MDPMMMVGQTDAVLNAVTCSTKCNNKRDADGMTAFRSMLLILICLVHLHACHEFPVFIRKGMTELTAMDVKSEATANGLYKMFNNESSYRLSIAGREIKKDDTPISELGICAQCVIDLEPDPPQFVYLWKMFKDLENPEIISWWNEVLECMQNPQDCQDIDYGFWAHIESNHQGHIKQIIMTDRGLRGCLNLDVPRQLRVLYMGNNHISSVNFSGLLGSRLSVLHLGNNKISNIDLLDLAGSELGLLYVSRNRIKYINLSGLSGSNLRVLGLAINQINSVEFNGLRDSKLKYLYMSYNQISIVDLSGISQSQLAEIDFDYNSLASVDLNALEGSELKWISLRRNPLLSPNVEEINNYKTEHPNLRITL